MSSESANRAIRIRDVTKAYHVYARPEDRLKQMLWPGHRRFYREFLAVRNVDLDVHQGETLGVVGRNGSGKSTLLKLISGTLQPTRGSVEVHGHVAPILTLGAGFDPEFTGRENVLVNAAVLGIPDREMGARMESIIEFADIGSFFDQPVKSYSSGMYSRLAFAVAINADPDLLVIDEVLAVGDEAFNRKCFARIDELKRAGSTILFASHSSQLIIELCDRAILMEAGSRLLTADPKTVVLRYQRLLHAPASERQAALEDIAALDTVLREGGSVPELAEPLPIAGTEISPEAEATGSFDPSLRSQSRVEYERKGARIENPRILDRDDRPVNVLHSGRVYHYAYEVLFDEPAFGVRFGMMLKLVTGFELGGQASHPWGEGFEYIEAGSRAHVRFPFRTQLVPGTYFVNAGVLGQLAGGEAYLHRILDAVAFRVDHEETARITGRVDLSAAKAAEIRLEAPDPTRERRPPEARDRLAVPDDSVARMQTK